MDDVPSSRKGVQLLHSGQREELQSKWRCWYERKISSESNREEIPKWKQLLATHSFSFPKNDDVEYPEVTNPEVINIEDDFYENTLLPEHLSTEDNGTNWSTGDDLTCTFQSDNSEPKEPSESEKVDFIIGNYDTEDEKRIENPKFWKESDNIEDLNADELDYTIENDDVKSEDSVLNPSLLMTRYNLNDNLNSNRENYNVKTEDSSKGLNSDNLGNFKTNNVDCRVENDNSKDKNSIMNPWFFMDPIKDKGFQTDHEKTNLYTDNYNMKRPSDIENRSDLQSNIPIFVSETSEEHSTRYLNDWENLSDFPNVGSTPSVSNTDTDSIVDKNKAPMQYYCPYPPKLPRNKEELPVKNSRENLVPEADYPNATDLLTEPKASRYTGMEHNSPVDFCPENYMIKTNSIANRLGTNTLTIPSAEQISQGDKSTISEHRYDNFPGVSKAKWMELLDSWKIGGRMLRPTQNSARSSVSPISDCSTEGRCRINGTFTSLDRGCFRPAIRYHGSHWISSLGGSSTRQSFSTISRKSEKKKHRRRNIIVIILIALALLAALAMIVGISIFFTKEKALLRAHISLIIDNREFHDAMKDTSSEDFLSIAKPLCNEMYKYFLTSELASHFVTCNVIKMVDVDGKVGVFFDLDFLKNSQTDSDKTIEDIIIKKSGRLVKNDKLYLVIRDFLVYVKSIKMTLETVYVPGPVELPDRHKYLTKVEWSTWSECSRSCGEGIQKRTRNCTEFDIQNHLCDGNEYYEQACQNNPCPALLRAHIGFMIDNIEFHDALKDNSSDDFHSIAKPLCNEMFKYFLTSELASHFVSCDAINIVDVDGKVEVFIDLDFLKNSQTDIEKTIEDIIIKKSGRLVKNDKLYLLIQGFLIDVKNEKTTLETVDVPGPVVLPDRDTYLKKVEWSTWSECSRSCGEGIQKRTRNCTEFDIKNHLCDGNEYNEQACQNNPCPALLRAHISLMIDNIEFHDALKDNSSDDFQSIAKPLCNEMYKYFLTSELASHFVSCDAINIIDVDGKVEVFIDLDFLKNSQTDIEKTIEDIIIKKSGRLVKNDKLYLRIQSFLVDVKSEKTILETVDVPGPVVLPDRDTYLKKVEWSTWSECSRSCGEGIQKRTRNCTEFDIQNHLCDGNEYNEQACQNNPCPALLRAHISLMIENIEFHDALKDNSSDDFQSIAKPLCNEMYKYFLTSELASHFVSCDAINIVDVDGKVEVFIDLDFLKNSQTDIEKTIEDIIIKKSGRLVKNDKLYLLIQGFLVDVKSKKTTLETVDVPGTVELPDRDTYLTKVEWSTWSECSRSCGEGIQKRFRYCSDFDMLHQLCDRNKDERICQHHPCPVEGKWAEWSNWEKCSMSCGQGVKTRRRECNNPSPSFGGQNCIGVNIDKKNCQERDCPINGMWSEWSLWNDCSGSCGAGRKERSRSCSNPRPKYGGRACVGDKISSSICNDQPCPEDGSWSEWNVWTDCSLSCDGGIKTRLRTCSNPEPKFGGKGCNGNEEESNKCGVQFCPVDGGWTEWTAWSGCSVSCGIGTRDRMRTCSGPEPKYGGQNCTGNNLDNKTCDSIPCAIHGEWSEWNEWTGCSVTCGSGIKERQRPCNNPHPKFGGKDCSGDRIDHKECNGKRCPVDGQWSGWSDWTDCSLSCGGGKTERNRTCNDPKPQNGGSNCTENDYEVKDCNFISCPIDGQWSEWSKWSECTFSCGRGYRLRNRSCTEPSPQFGGELCHGNETETDICNLNDCPVDGNWSPWGNWQECSTTCDGGTKTRNRTCTDPVPLFGGVYCNGNNTEAAMCNNILCPIDGKWSHWSKWQVCSVSCGGGNQTRNRTCNNPEPQLGGEYCDGNDSEDIACNKMACPIDGIWSNWNEWTACSLSCGSGTQSRNRTCNDPEPQYGGTYCSGNNTEEQRCKEDPCPIDGNWSDWSTWGICTVSCGDGSKTRDRTCTNPIPQNGGLDCTGNETDVGFCNYSSCAINGNWTEWSDWSECSVSCGGGIQEKYRNCSNPVPEFGGEDCFGNNTEISFCNSKYCPIDGSWSTWSYWGNCSLSCGGGSKSRNRSCTDPEPNYGGDDCYGNSTEKSSCNETPCPINGSWTTWSAWNECSVSCGGGILYRNRSCSNPDPQYGGKDCIDNATDTKSCNHNNCPIDGSWTNWSEWSICSESCGGGLMLRNRTCSDPEPLFGGDNCIGNSTENYHCNDNECPVNGNWTDWSVWSTCSHSCGEGFQSRNRTCSNPVPQFGGNECLGNGTEDVMCNEHHCPVDGNWTKWSEWDNCTQSCGGGVRSRLRICSDPEPSFGGENCLGNSTERNICNDHNCPVDGNWTDWSEWGSCSDTCGSGLKLRYRNCSNPEPQFGGIDCVGNKTEIDSCNEQYCPVDGSWAEWAEWNNCTYSCGGGLQFRNRTCSDPEPQFGGKECIGNSTDNNLCNEHQCPVDGSWTEWSEWNNCTDVCGGGLKSRNRTCSDPEPHFGGKDCIGNNTQNILCNEHHCPVDGNWSEWSAWEECSVTCGGGLKTRNRTCTNPASQYEGKDCSGNSTNISNCAHNPCPINGNWTEWSSWNECSVICGGGIKVRDRNCSNPVPRYGGDQCFGNSTNSDTCNEQQCPIDGNWSGWSQWEECSVTCGGGLKTRNRTCSNPAPQFRGKHCLGNDTLISNCADNPCPINGNWTEWSIWNECSVTCGGGIKVRDRNCSNPIPQYGGESCFGNATSTETCNEDQCPINGNWTEWSSWNECSVTCGGGMKVRDRNCSSPVPQYGGDPCFGNSTNIDICNEDPCSIDGNWSGWSEWEKCSVTCGGGLKTRNRTCSNPEPQFGGKYCTGNDTHISDCADNPCPINGNWTEWSSWNECSVTCGGGMKVRDRTCSNPVPQYGGDPCFGNTTNFETCSEELCPIDGNWSGWSEWEECSVKCGGGLKTRNRTCSNPEPQFGGKYCTGNDTHISNCADNPCPINGNWTEWSSWNECSVTCGGGMKVRDRHCSNPVPQYGGDPCFGNTTNIESCNEDPCPIDGIWSGWSEWEECSVTCGGGRKTRNRTCSNPEPQFGGKYCTGNDTNISNCADNLCPINGNWTEWSSWNECSVTCGGGRKVRDRQCSNPVPQYGGDPCFGNTTNIDSCNEDPCPIDGNWSGWSEWEECSVTCGGGLKTRNRTCSNPEPQFGGKYCTGNDTHISNCADNPCPINGNWTEWSSWNECSVTCGGGRKVRDRQCSNPVPQYGGDPCFGNTTNIESCNEDPCPIDGNWSGWSEWEECSVTCGGGLKTRNRTCSNPEPQFGGKYCTGNDTHISNCADNPCPINGNWTEWSSWNECSVTCGGGRKVRDRQCSNPVPQYGGDPCFGNTTNIESCNEDPCPIDGNWSGWSEWEECSVTCGGGLKTRNRTCSNPEPQFGGKYCTGNDTHISNCADNPCPINGNWTEWSSWNECSVTCGGGMKVRDRKCSNPVPQYGGDPCFGNITNIETCNEDPCPIDGNWSGWSEWEECSVTCGGGLKTRNRTCSNPEPQFGGKYCTGNDTHISKCADNPCPIDGHWTEWSSWNECSITCGGGLKDRERTCSNPLPRYGGNPCVGNATTSETCNEDLCPINGQWSQWTDFTSCSQTCGGGLQSRNRSCTDPEPQYGGDYCVGVENETNSCNNQPCPINGNWTEWSNWSACPVSCGGDKHTRMRSCTNPKPQFGGDFCDGNNSESQSCNFHHCPIHGQWSSWSELSDCDRSCGGGMQNKNRSCSNPKPEYGGNQCLGKDNESIECNKHSCPVNGNWTTWSGWAECPVSCGGSRHTRTRSCTKPKPQYGGDECEGNKTETQICNTQHCPIDGQWSNWSDFTSCSETCGGGDHSRNRSCTAPAPKYGGQHCPGEENQTKNCNTHPCPINGNWTSWSEWSVCPVSCGGGRHSRSRSCTNPTPMYGGSTCKGNTTDNQLCNPQHCPIDGEWTSWTAWSVCSVTCGGGKSARTRSCSDPAPQYNGSNCSGQDKENRVCNTINCPVDGEWSEWMPWSTCTVSCGGGGFQQRKRDCTNPSAKYGGKDCNGNDAEIQDCGDLGCPGLLFTPTEEFEGASAVLAKCRIENFTSWQELEIAKNSREMVILQSKGIETSNLGSAVAVSNDIKDMYAEIQLSFNKLSCKDEGTYVCSVDRGYHRSADLIVKTPPVGKPVFDINTEIFGERSEQFSCTGNPGYPKGHLEFWVKFRNETEYQEYRFHSAVRTVTDKNCRRQETVQVDYFFPMRWNGAKIRCKAPDSEEYTEREIWLISEYYCESVPLFSTVRHPYTCKKYMRCLEDKVDVMECPEGLCYNEESQLCVYQ